MPCMTVLFLSFIYLFACLRRCHAWHHCFFPLSIYLLIFLHFLWGSLLLILRTWLDWPLWPCSERQTWWGSFSRERIRQSWSTPPLRWLSQSHLESQPTKLTWGFLTRGAVICLGAFCCTMFLLCLAERSGRWLESLYLPYGYLDRKVCTVSIISWFVICIVKGVENVVQAVMR